MHTFYSNIFLLPPYSFSGWLRCVDTPLSSVLKQQFPSYRYLPRSRFGVPVRIISTTRLDEQRPTEMAVRVTLQTAPQREGARYRKQYPNYVRVLFNWVPLKPWLQKYIHLFTEPFPAVRRVITDVIPLFPVEPEAWWFGITTVQEPDRKAIGEEMASISRAVSDEEIFGEEAVQKAYQLLQQISKAYGWEISDNYVHKKIGDYSVKIMFSDLKVYINGCFTCITSTPMIPKYDQVTQKLISLSIPRLARQINTLPPDYIKKLEEVDNEKEKSSFVDQQA